MKVLLVRNQEGIVMTEDVKMKVKEYLLDNFLMGEEEEEIEDNSSFLDMGIIDSTGILELVSFLEKTFDLEITDQEMVPENLDSLESIEKFVGIKKSN